MLKKIDKKIVRLVLYPVLFCILFISFHAFILNIANFPSDYSDLHFTDPTLLQSLFLDNVDKVKPYGIEFILMCVMMISAGLFLAIWRNIKTSYR